MSSKSRSKSPKNRRQSKKEIAEREARVDEELLKLKLIQEKKARDFLIVKQKWAKSMVSALYFHKFNGDKQMLEQLNSGVGKRVWDPNGSINGKTALRWACVYRDVKLIKHLIEVMECTVTNVSVDDGDGWSPLIEAAAQGWTEGVDILLKKKHPVDHPTDIGGRNALLHAAKNGYYKTCKFLIGKGAFPDMVDNNRYNALMYVVKEDFSYHEKCMKRQKELRDMWFKTMDGKNKTKSRPNSKQGAKKKGKAGRSKSPTKNKKGGGNKKKKESKKEEPATSNAKAPSKFDKIQIVPQHKKILKLLILKKANVNHRDRWQRTVLSHAAEAGNRKACRMLIDANARLDEADKDGKTPLHWAVYAGKSRTMRLLVKKGANLNIQDRDQYTPLMLACRLNRRDDAMFLMAMGTNKNIQTGHGYTALKISLFHHHTEITRLLRLQRNWVLQEYKAWRYDRREQKREKARQADQLIELQRKAAEEAELKRREEEAAKKKKKKGGGRRGNKKGGKKNRPKSRGSQSIVDTSAMIGSMTNMGFGAANNEKKKRRVLAPSDVSSEPETSEFEDDGDEILFDDGTMKK